MAAVIAVLVETLETTFLLAVETESTFPIEVVVAPVTTEPVPTLETIFLLAVLTAVTFPIEAVVVPVTTVFAS